MVPGGGNGPINSVNANTPGGSADVGRYQPDVFLLNGQSYPNTGITPVSTTDCLAVHYANMGLLEKSFGVVDRRETITADDSVPLAHPQNLDTKYLNPGQVADAVVDMTGTATGTFLPIMDYGRHLNNGSGSPNNAVTPSANTGMTLGGQLSLIQVVGQAPTSKAPSVSFVGLDATTVAVSAAGVAFPAALNLTVTANAANGPITGGEYSVDSIVPAGTGTPGISAAGTAAIPTSSFSTLGNGDHIIWARVKNAAGVWSDPPSGVVFTYDRLGTAPNPQGGPVLENLSVDPTVTNGNTADKTPGLPLAVAGPQCDLTNGAVGAPAISCDMVLGGTATPPLADWSISAFNWSVGTASGTVAVNGAPGSPAQLTATVPAATLKGAGLSQGQNNVTFTATETQGANTRTSNPSTVAFTWVTTGPAATVDTFNPAVAGPEQDFLGNANYFPAVQITGTITDATAPIADGEMWWLPIVNNAPVGELTPGSPIANGGGVKVTPDSGVWSVPASATPVPFKVSLPSAEFTGLPQGMVRIYAHGRDVAGNWGAWTSRDIKLDKTAPVVSTTPAPVVTQPTAGHYTLTFTAQDPATAPPACTVTGTGAGAKITGPAGNPPVPEGRCGVAEQSTVAAVEWQIAYDGVIDVPAQNDFTVMLPAPTNGPSPISVDLSGGPKPYPAGASQAVFRVMDGAGNWSNWSQVNF